MTTTETLGLQSEIIRILELKVSKYYNCEN